MHPARTLIAGPPEAPGTGPAGDSGSALTVGLFCPAWPPEHFANGIITYVDAIAEGMRRLGHRPIILAGAVTGPVGSDVTAPVINLRTLSEPTGPGKLAEVLAFWLRPGAPTTRTIRLGRALRRSARGAGGVPKLDLIEVEETLGLPGAVAGRVPVPVVARLHGPWFLNGPNQGGDPADPAFAQRVRAEGRALRAVDGVTAPSADVLNRSRTHYGLPMRGGEAIPNPVRLVPPDRRWRPDGCEPDHLLFVGRFDRHKGGDTIIDAFAMLLRDRPGARLTFVGPDRGLEQDGRRWSLADYVEHRIPGASADGRVRCLDRRTPEEITALRPTAAVTVVSSRYETFAITATEAMAAGCPLVATRAGGTAELFEHGRHGLYVEPDDPSGLAAAVAALLADPARASAMGRAALEHCERRYAPEVVAAETVRYYRRVLADAASRGVGAKEVRP